MSAAPILKQQLRVAGKLGAVTEEEKKHYEQGIDRLAREWAAKGIAPVTLAAPKRRKPRPA